MERVMNSFAFRVRRLPLHPVLSTSTPSSKPLDRLLQLDAVPDVAVASGAKPFAGQRVLHIAPAIMTGHFPRPTPEVTNVLFQRVFNLGLETAFFVALQGALLSLRSLHLCSPGDSNPCGPPHFPSDADASGHAPVVLAYRPKPTGARVRAILRRCIRTVI